MQLLCFPYAGGSTILFRNWRELMPPGIEVRPVELPGRGRRIQEPPFRKMELLVESVATVVTASPDKPYAFFGHSMGAAICFALAHRLRELGKLEPAHLFVSARRAPTRRQDDTIYNLAEAEFLNQLRQLGGTPQEVFDNPEALELLIPLLRADFELIETWNQAFTVPLSCPITAVGGSRDEEVSVDDLMAWQEETTGTFRLHIFDGDHFFLRQPEPLVRLVAGELLASPAVARS